MMRIVTVKSQRNRVTVSHETGENVLDLNYTTS
jgi:hypothetical protein